MSMITATAPTMNSKTLLTRENTPDSPNKVVGWSAPRAELAPSAIEPIAATGSGDSAAMAMVIEARILMIILVLFIMIFEVLLVISIHGYHQKSMQQW